MVLYVLNAYHAHSYAIERITMSSDESTLFTLSSGDSMLCQWGVNMLAIEGAPKMDVEALYKSGLEGTTEAINRELQYAFNPFANEDTFEQRGDPTVLVKGSRNKQINDILVAESAEQELDPTLKPPIGSLVLERILGVQCGNRRNTLKYFHSPIRADATSSPKAAPIATDRIPLIPEPMPIKKCLKWVTYYASRYVILEDPHENAQYIYDSHKSRITCLAIHPSGSIFASGECSANSTNNCVHVWDTTTRESIVVLKTVHESGVSLLDFSSDGTLLLTFGSGKQSMQIFNWRQEREIAFRHLNTTPILDIRFDPINTSRIIAIGFECIVEISLISGSLSITNIIPVPGTSVHKRVFLCMDFIQYMSASTNTVNVFIGSSLGDVGVLSGSKFSIIPSITHDGAINVLKVSRALLKPFCVITAGDDDKIKVWDSFMGCLAAIAVPGFELYRELAIANNTGSLPEFGGVQSLDLCACDEEKPFLLIGMRNGDVLELAIQLKAEEEKSMATSSITGGSKIKFSLEAVMLMGEHSSQGMNEDERKLCICLHPKFPILVSGGYDCTLRFWDMSMNMLLRTIPLGKKMKVSAIAFSPTANSLAVGFTNGTVQFYPFSEDSKEGRTARFDPQVGKPFTTREARGTVLLIRYSIDAEFVAVSYDSEVVSVVNPAGEKVEVKQGKSCVVVYVQTNSSKSPGIQKSKDPYSKLFQITFPIAHIEAEHPSVLSATGATPRMENSHDSELSRAFTHMDFAEDNSLLQLCYMPVSLHGKVEYSKPPLCLVWNLNSCQVVEDWERLRKIEWQQWSLAPTVYARTLGNKLFAISPEEEQELLQKEEVVFSALEVFGRNQELVCAGSSEGDLHLFRHLALLRPNEAIAAEKNGIIRKDQMEVAKSYSACCSSVECVQVYSEGEQNYVFVSSSSDEVILKYRFEKENVKWDLDYYTLNEERADPYSELPPPDRFDMIMKECWIPRSRIFELSEKLAPPPHPCDLRSSWVFGRRAYDRRNNLLLDYMQRVVYHAGTMLVMINEGQRDEYALSKRLLQRFQKTLPSTRNVAAFTSPEISCMCTNNDHHMIALGTAEVKAHIYVWDVSHDTEVGSVALPNVSVVYCMKFNQDNRHIAAVGLNKDFRQVVLLADIKQQEVLAMTTLIHALPYKVREIEFYPESTTRLVTAGIQHLTFWKTNGKYMEPRCAEFMIAKFKQPEEASGEIKSGTLGPHQKYGAGKVCLPEQLVEAPGTDPDVETVYVTFMGVGFIKNTMISVGDDGFIYVWDEEKILRRKKAHDDCILCLHVESETGLVVTGGNDGYVIVWGFNSAHEPLNRDIIQKASLQVPSVGPVATLLKPLSAGLGSAILPAGNCVQSVWLSKNSLLVGTKNGAIHAVDVKISSGEFKLKSQGDGSLFRKVLDATDDEIPKCIAYDARNKRLLCISQRGFLAVWCLETNLLICGKGFDKPALYVHAFNSVSKVLVAFENEVNMLNDNYDILESFSIKKSAITAVKVSNNEKVIALASTNAKAPELEIYDIENKFHEFHSIKGYKANIVNIDFTSEDKYMICQDELGDTYLYDRERLERIGSEEEEELKLYWQSFGLTIDSDFTEVSKHYNDTNKIYAISRFPNKNLVAVGDQIGSVSILYKHLKQLRLYKYPLEYTSNYFACKCEHLNWLCQCVINSEGSMMFTFSESDRCIIKWSIHHVSEAGHGEYQPKKITWFIFNNLIPLIMKQHQQDRLIQFKQYQNTIKVKI
eukprot:TRINITY_DN2537_c0_g1_i1.p1 TRINITY_DN2537_c0_g1~~TRINITY_DN2537_c0_g1_i1.p1  ORF type:complete len:1738 (+),score=108.49 TRINITY_DN2537_c0_g1_i1:2814-8027(+)